MIKKLLSAAALFGALVASPAHAGLADAIDGMFMTNTTDPQSFKTQTRGGFVGGSIAMRAPIRNINLVSFDPPRLSAGCGGIDMYGGSFSFINSDQLVALFRQVAANAVGLAFKAAIDYINPALAKQMQDFQAKIQALNENLKNTCAIANQLIKTVTSSPSARKEDANNEAASAQATKGAFDDMWSGMTSFFTSPNKATKEANAAGLCESCGNLVWRALVDSNAASMLGNPDTSETSVNAMNELLMSLTGYVVTTKDKADTTTVAGKTQQEVGEYKPNTLILQNLITGISDKTPLKVYTCDKYGRDECTNVGVTNFTFEGITGYVNRMMFGTSNGAIDGIGVNSILGKLKGCQTTSCNFTPSQIAFIEQISQPTMSIMIQVQHSEAALEMVGAQLVPMITAEMAVKYGQAVTHAVRHAFAGGKTSKPESVDKQYQSLMGELSDLRAQALEQSKRALVAKEFANEVLKSTPGVLARVNK